MTFPGTGTEVWRDRASGLTAVICIDSTVLGPAVGGIRTRRYDSLDAARTEVQALARAMTLKCSLAGLDAGGGKVVVIENDLVDRQRAFEVLGARIEALGGLFRTAGDFGTSADDLVRMASTCQYVHTDDTGLASAVGRSVVRCIEACTEVRGLDSVSELCVAVQGAGAIGVAVARELAAAGAQVCIADVDEARADAVARETGARVVDPGRILTEDVDVVAPCAIGGVIDDTVASALHAWAVCGAANNILAAPEVSRQLLQRKILHVPDVLASAGAVIEGIGRTVMRLDDREPLIDALRGIARELLEHACASGVPTEQLAGERARARIESR